MGAPGGVVRPARPPPLHGHMSSSLYTYVLQPLSTTFMRPATCSGHSAYSTGYLCTSIEGLEFKVACKNLCALEISTSSILLQEKSATIGLKRIRSQEYAYLQMNYTSNTLKLPVTCLPKQLAMNIRVRRQNQNQSPIEQS